MRIKKKPYLYLLCLSSPKLWPQDQLIKYCMEEELLLTSVLGSAQEMLTSLCLQTQIKLELQDWLSQNRPKISDFPRAQPLLFVPCFPLSTSTFSQASFLVFLISLKHSLRKYLLICTQSMCSSSKIVATLSTY